jgi:hypothetical protein
MLCVVMRHTCANFAAVQARYDFFALDALERGRVSVDSVATSFIMMQVIPGRLSSARPSQMHAQPYATRSVKLECSDRTLINTLFALHRTMARLWRLDACIPPTTSTLQQRTATRDSRPTRLDCNTRTRRPRALGRAFCGTVVPVDTHLAWQKK